MNSVQVISNATVTPWQDNGQSTKELDAIREVFNQHGLNINLKQVTGDKGASFLAFELDEESKQAIQRDPALLQRIKNGLFAAGCAGGIIAAICTACCAFTTFALVGGIVLGIGNARAEAGDNSQQTKDMQIAGTWLLIGGAIFSGVTGAITGIAVGVGACLTG